MPDNGHQYTPGSIGSNSLLEPVDPGVYWCPLSGLLQNCSWRGHICLAWPATTTIDSSTKFSSDGAATAQGNMPCKES